MLAPERMESLASLPLLIIDDLGMRKLSLTAAEELLDGAIGWCVSIHDSLLQVRICGCLTPPAKCARKVVSAPRAAREPFRASGTV